MKFEFATVPESTGGRPTSNLAEYGDFAEPLQRETTWSLTGSRVSNDLRVYISYSSGSRGDAASTSAWLPRPGAVVRHFSSGSLARTDVEADLGLANLLARPVTEAAPTADAWTPLFLSMDTSTAEVRDERVWSVVQDALRLVARHEAHPTESALKSLVALLRRFARNGEPAAQIAATPSGSLELVWLRRGLMLSFILGEDGSLYCWSEQSDGEELFEFEASHPDALSTQALQAIWSVLKRMSSDALALH